MSVGLLAQPATRAPRPRRDGGTLACAGISVAFGPTVVLDDVALDLRAGEVHVLIGPNGAGKTTLANVITGHVAARSGSVVLNGRPLTGRPSARARRGLGRKFQIPRVFPRLTVREQLELAAPHADLAALRAQLDEVGDVLGEQLSHGWRQWVELQMVLLQQPSVIVLDEPTAGMPRSERGRLAETLEAVAHGTFLVVEHDLDFVARIADRVSFMHNGRVVRTGTFDEVTDDPIVRSAYLGTGAHAA
jgi:ABC-type uncharacterized transport system ATPase subunit